MQDLHKTMITLPSLTALNLITDRPIQQNQEIDYHFWTIENLKNVGKELQLVFDTKKSIDKMDLSETEKNKFYIELYKQLLLYAIHLDNVDFDYSCEHC